MKSVLIIYAHPDEKSFNAAIRDTIVHKLEMDGTEYNVIDLYAENYYPVLSDAEMKGEISKQTKWHQLLIKMATDIVFIFPVWWFRAPAILEGFIDKTFVPKFAYQFKPIIGKYGMPIPLLKDKKVTVLVTHGAPALPIKTLYVNVVKYRFLLGFLSFCFNIFKCKIVQFWSVPFINEAKRNAYLLKAERIIHSRIRNNNTVNANINIKKEAA
jgi:NAD(P)H dehydrogenase (quinone)